jgi:UDP-N-acetylglucosamine acyltransferase
MSAFSQRPSEREPAPPPLDGFDSSERSAAAEREPLIHPTAILHPSARVGRGVRIGPNALIGANVELGDECVVDAFATILGPATLGPRNRVHHYAAVGTDSQDLKYRGGETWLRMGAENIVREYVTINRASDAGGATLIGDGNVFMANSHVAHNCVIGNHTIFANAASVGGHCVVEDYAILGGLAAIHQFCRIGSQSLVGAGAKLVKDVPPYCLADGAPARLAGVNKVGLARRGFQPEQIAEIKRMVVALFWRKSNLALAVAEWRSQGIDNPFATAMMTFIESSQRGLIAPARRR